MGKSKRLSLSIISSHGYTSISLDVSHILNDVGATGIMLGYKFRISTLLFGIPYWYILLLDKSYWNNHSYLFGIVTILLSGSSANHYFSLDGYFEEKRKNRHVPCWNYFILKYQFFMLYFLAGLKKADMEWLEGYSMQSLGNHWIFLPFRLFLTSDQVDYLIVHWFGFLLDLTIGFWMLIESTRPVAMVFCTMFHLMNSRLFSIGMFPYVCLATMPLFCEETWPRKLLKYFHISTNEPLPTPDCIYIKDGRGQSNKQKHVTWKRKLVIGLLLTHCSLQVFLPYSHFITQGYNNWTKGLYGYSWDMMVHSWDTIQVVVRVVDNEFGEQFFIDPDAWTQNDRWNKHADMCVQYANCLKRNLMESFKNNSASNEQKSSRTKHRQISSENLSVYIDVWCSLNKRFQQRMYNPNYDLLKAKWSPFNPVEWLLPVLTEYNNFRKTMNEIAKKVYTWSNDSDVLFIADFPGMYLENYIDDNMQNLTLTVLEGKVVYEIEDDDLQQSAGVVLSKYDSIPVENGVFHKIHTVSDTPACYMYTYVNFEKRDEEEEYKEPQYNRRSYAPFPVLEDFSERKAAVARMWKHISGAIEYFLFNKPYNIRQKT
ncbi:unnamed protein product [Acanthoscelides obtectus]|uniref:HTTM-like domain-containing protein n=1 Tax=Acanthoscelides obtectus TaxID=200917 RepID=A0A9P0JJ81_ACAOB|nr:unnamed protein product [Acanthoscelides obtectus]CAK1639700.1 Vitamin K-dependent gamma-carboxylase [Acanthoscelides obtectus]